MKSAILGGILAVYVFSAVFLQLQGGIDLKILAASGPAAIGAFAFGYAIDLLIFGILVRKFHRARKRKAAVA